MNINLQLVLAFVGPLVGIYLGVFLAERKAYRERVWDLKAHSYSGIFEALEKMRRFFETAMLDLARQRDLDPTDEAAANQIYRETRDQLFLIIARESWLLPDAVDQQIGTLEKRLRCRHDSYFESIADGQAELKSTFATLRDFARSDMATRTRSWRERLTFGLAKS